MSIIIMRSAISAYQDTETEIVRNVGRSIQSFVANRLGATFATAGVGEAIEQDIFRLFVDPVRLLQSGDAWIYAPDHVVYDKSSDFPDKYRGKSMEEVFAIQKLDGASHYEEMTAAVMAAQEGIGWYVWLPAKGPEIAAWSPVKVGPFTWVVGLSTPLKEILDSTGAARQIRTSREILGALTLLVLALLVVGGLAETRRSRFEALLKEQKDLSLKLGALLPLDECLQMCASTASRLLRGRAVSIYLADQATGRFILHVSTNQGVLPVEWEPDPRTVQALVHPNAFQRTFVERGATAVTIAPITEDGRAIGCIAAIDRPRCTTASFRRRALEAVAAVLATAMGRLRMEESLRENERRFKSVVDTAADAIVTVAPSGRIVFWNKAAWLSFGISAEKAAGAALSDFIALRTGEREDGAPEREGKARLLGVRADGTRFPIEISSAAWGTRDGTFTTHVIRDMSMHERAEKERWELQQRLQRAERMESLGILAGGVAHDLNNMLTPIVGYADIMMSDVPPDSPLRESLSELYRSARRAGAIVQDLLTLGRRGTVEMGPLDLNGIVRECLASPAFLEAQARAPGVSPTRDLAPDLRPIRGSAPHLLTLVANLVLNGFEAMPKGGRLTLSTSNRTLAEPLAGYERIEAGDYAVLEVADAGPSIEAKDLERIFEPFYTKKKMGRSGSGLGLAVVYGVAHDHGGRVDVRTTAGSGTVFEVWLPASSEQPLRAEHALHDLRGTERVLIVDDQADVRLVASRLLGRYGYSVQTAESGRAAIAWLRGHAVDLVVLDMIMEEDFDGLDCWREIVRMHPRQKGIIVSGFAETDRVQEAKRLGVGAFVKKPYSAEELAVAVRLELARLR
jgi:PAS domain S-box-containing protein